MLAALAVPKAPEIPSRGTGVLPSIVMFLEAHMVTISEARELGL